MGADCRNSSKSIVSLLSSLLTAAGFYVSDAGLTPAPALRLSVRNFEYSGGIMVTGSAEPPGINRLKLFDSLGFPLTLSQRPTMVVRKTSWDKLGAAYPEEQVVPNYMRKLVAASLGPFKRHIKIVIDIGNGMQALAGPRIIENLGATVITLNGNIDGAFPSRGPALSPKSLRGLSEVVREFKAHLGIAYDADGDRAVFLDANGLLRAEDLVAGQILRFILRGTHQRTVVTSGDSTTIQKLANEFRLKLIQVQGHSANLSHLVAQYGAIFGYNGNGRYVYTLFAPIEDPVIASILLAHSICSNDTPGSD